MTAMTDRTLAEAILALPLPERIYKKSDQHYLYSEGFCQALRAASALAASMPAQAEQSAAVPVATVQAFGVKADGSQDDLGQMPEWMFPGFKMKEIVRSYFGDPDDDDNLEAGMALSGIEEFLKWYVEQRGLNAAAEFARAVVSGTEGAR